MSEKNAQVQILYEHMRHPMFIGPLLVIWMTPIMTLDRFCAAIGESLRIHSSDLDRIYHLRIIRQQNH
jgi:hypothetical protein